MGVYPLADKKNLEQRGLKWWAYRTVPPSLRKKIDKRQLRINLNTSDLKEAQRLRSQALAKMDIEIERARRPCTNEKDLLLERALEWRGDDILDDDDDPGEETKSSLVSDLAENIKRDHGYAEAKRFYDIAMGDQTPLDLHFGQFSLESHVHPRTTKERETILKRLAEWEPVSTLEAINRRRAGRFVSEVLAEGHHITANKKISHLSAYWQWLLRKGILSENPWRDQRLSTRRHSSAGNNNTRERAFTDDEACRLLAECTSARLETAMQIAALSGLRIEEICQLQVQDCDQGVFNIRVSKTHAGIRKVPIHSELVVAVDQRVKGKNPSVFLIHELGPPRSDKSGQKRSMPLTKEFTRYRRKLGIDERPNGRRRSLVNFHSFRRWFITKAEQAEQHPWIIEAVVGHQRQGMTLSVYAQGPSVEQLTECVQSVTFSGA